MIQEWKRELYSISTERERLDIDVIHGFLSRAYWSVGVPREIVSKALDHSLNFGLFKGEELIGFARVVTDYATFAYVADVFVLEAYRGLGLSKWLMQCVVSHPELQHLRLWTLRTKDAHGLYRQFGFAAPSAPERAMERFFPDVYKQTAQKASE
jgi:GNAT superfamily N-acetyltransferase